MSVALVVLCLAAFAATAGGVSLLVAGTLPLTDRLARCVTPRHRVRFWLCLAALPTVVGVLAVTASLFPAMGLGTDHCLTHGAHHPHLCPHHVATAPGSLLIGAAALVGLRVVYTLCGLIRGAHLSGHTARRLVNASHSYADALVFPSDAPQAFVLGLLRPRIHISSGLLALGAPVVQPVLAHERAHVMHRDFLWRVLAPVLGCGHVPAVAAALRSRLTVAQEMAADRQAATGLPGGGLQLAESLLAVAKCAPASLPGLAFTEGDLSVRVHALLDDKRYSRWPARVLMIGVFSVPILITAAHEPVHHGLETLIGALS